MRSLPLRYDAKVSSIEESRDLTKMKMDELHGTFTTYEMRTYIEYGQSTSREVSSKASNKRWNKGHKPKER